MRYYLDTEFIECAKQRKALGISVGAPVPAIDLISIALVAEDGRELYLLNAECELKYAWANEWVRQNVLLPIYKEHIQGDRQIHEEFSLGVVRRLFKSRGFRKAELAMKIAEFTGYYQHFYVGCADGWRWERSNGAPKPSFYGYYCDYDWVVFCQLFGRMLDLPKGFPMYCIDLKQEINRLGITSEQKQLLCPDPVNEHNALADARWNKQLHAVLKGQEAHVD
ncbi:MAG: 3'-5' exoribonuclease [Hymenobacter sp.]|nr:MAG: 3'-5' exoribonuclease [Hymenobacter sp.]